MHRFIFLFLLLLAFQLRSQVGQVTVTPANPTPADTILVITNFTYSGNCTYGMVGSYTSTTGNTVYVMPTYCGYGSHTTTCNETDTIKINPLSLGNYTFHIEFHQGSVCPFSGFDITLDTVIVHVQVKASTVGVKEHAPSVGLDLFPNPNSGTLHVKIRGTTGKNQLRIYDLTGRQVFTIELTDEGSYLIPDLAPGSYECVLSTLEGQTLAKKRVVTF